MKNKGPLLIKRGSFVAVRHDDGWWLAQLYTHIYQDSDKVRICWYDEEKYNKLKSQNRTYKIHDANDVPAESILCTVQVSRISAQPKRVQLDASEIKSVDAHLNECKNAKMSKKSFKGKVQLKTTSKRSKASPKKVKPAPGKRKSTAKLKTPPVKKQKVSPYVDVPVFNSDPLFDKDTVLQPVAPDVNNNIFIRAVVLNNVSEVKRLAKDLELFSGMFSSVYYEEFPATIIRKSAWHHAIDRRDRTMIKLLQSLAETERATKKQRVSGTESQLHIVKTGVYNPASLGIERIRPLTMARGSKQGVNAFEELCFSRSSAPDYEEVVEYAIKSGCTYDFLTFLYFTINKTKNAAEAVEDQFSVALRANNLEVATKIVEMELKEAGGGPENYNKLHHEVLAFRKGETLSEFKSVSVTKKTYGKRMWYRRRRGGGGSEGLTPLHSACLNSNTKYLKQMLSVNPQLGIVDGSGNTLLHYAAIATTNAATTHLLSAGIDPLVTNSSGESPLHWAAERGSIPNIKALIGHGYATYFESKEPTAIDPTRVVDVNLIKVVTRDAAKYRKKTAEVDSSSNKDGGEGDGEGDTDWAANMLVQTAKKQGIAGMETVPVKGTSLSFTPLALAVIHGQEEAVTTLLKLGANPNKPTSASRRRMFPINLAAMYGHLAILKVLILHGAKARSKDRHGLLAFHHAAKYNQLHCLSWLAAHVITDANVGDSSGNTALHYACAEGYLPMVRYLVEELKVETGTKNDWGMCAFEVATLRQQRGVVEWMVKNANVDLNFKDSAGATYVMKLCTQNMDREGVRTSLLFYLEQPGVDVTAVDNCGCNALHYMACQTRGTFDFYDRLIEELISRGLDITAVSEKGETPLSTAVQRPRPNRELIRALIKHGSRVGEVWLANNRNILMHFVNLPCDSSTEILQTMVATVPADQLHGFTKHRDTLGMTVITIAAIRCFQAKQGKKSNDEEKKNAWLVLEMLRGEPFNCDINEAVGERKLGKDAVCTCKAETREGNCHLGTCDVYPYGKSGTYRLLNFAMKCNGTEEEIDKVLAMKPDVNYADRHGMYPLHYAIKSQKSSLVEKLISSGALVDVLPNAGVSNNNRDVNVPSIVLAAMSCLDAVSPLLKAGACVFASAPDGRDLLHHLVSSQARLTQRIELVEQILPLVEDVNRADEEGNTYLHHAVRGVNTGSDISIEMISALLLKGANPNLANKGGQTPLHFVFLTRNFDCSFSDPIEVASMLTQVMSPDMIKKPDDFNQFTALHLSAMRGGSVSSTHLISKGCMIDELDYQGNTPLCHAVVRKHQSCSLMLIEKGAETKRDVVLPMVRQKEQDKQAVNGAEEDDVEPPLRWAPLEEKPLDAPILAKTNNGLLYYAISHGWQGVVFKLVDVICSSFIPIEAALQLHQLNLVITLILKFGRALKTSETNDKGQTLTHLLCLTKQADESLQVRIMNLLQKLNFDFAATDSYGCTPLHYACLLKKIELVKILIPSNTINTVDTFDRKPVCGLFWNEAPTPEMIELLVGAGASLDDVYDFNIQESTNQLFDFSFKKFRSNYFTSFSKSYSLLGKMVIEGELELVRTLLDLGAGVSLPDSAGMTPLMYAARLNKVKIFRLLLEKTSPEDLLLQNEDGDTVLGFLARLYPAVELTNPVLLKECVTFLKSKNMLKGALELKNNRGWMVADECKDKPHYLSALGMKKHKPSETDDELMVIVTNKPNVAADSREFLEEFAKTCKPEVSGADLAVPDSCLSLSETECEVMKEENTGRYYDILMTKVDISVRSHGLYTFYKMQIVKNLGKSIFVLLTRWGRIGDEGQHQETPFPTFEECLAEFHKVFKAKTKNDYSNIENFVNHPRKYRLVPRNFRYKDQYKHIEYNFRKDSPPATLNSKVFDTILEAADPKYMEYILNDELKLDVTNSPFSFPSEECVAKGEAILKRVLRLLGRVQDLRYPKDGHEITEAEEKEYIEAQQKLYDLSNELHFHIPQTGFTVTRIDSISRHSEWQEWREKLRNIKDVEVVNRIMAGSQRAPDLIHPIDYIYRSLDCGMEPLERNDPVTQYILRNIYATNGSYTVRNIFKLTPDSPRSGKPKGKRVLLFHGISTCALLSIMKRGLINAPYGHAYGSMHGSGIYLSDNFQKAHSYAQGNNFRYVVLASVDLGNVFVKARYLRWFDGPEEPKTDVDTRHVLGNQAQYPDTHEISLDGARFNLGRFWPLKKIHDEEEEALGEEVADPDYVPPKKNCCEEDEDEERSDSGSSYSTASECQDEAAMDAAKKAGTIAYDRLPEYSEFVIQDPKSIQLEYLIQTD